MFNEISQKLTLHAKKSLREAENISQHYGSEFVEPIHLLLAIYLENGSLGKNVLKGLGIKKNHFEKILVHPDKKNSKKIKVSSKLSSSLKSTITRAYFLASNFNYPYVGTEHLIYALIESSDESIKKILQNATPEDFSSETFAKENLNIPSPPSGFNNDSLSGLSRLLNLPSLGVNQKTKLSGTDTPILDQFCLDLNKYAQQKKETIIGREKEIGIIMNILGRKNKNNPLLTGDPGVGKTAIVEGLAQKINSGEVSPYLLGKRILSLDITSVVAGTSFRGEFENRMKEIIQEASRNKNIILFIDEIHSIIGTGNVSGSLDAANILKPILSRGDIQCIGATTLDEYKKYIEKDPALERRFQNIKISEPSAEETEKILLGTKKNYEKFHNLSISNDAVKQSVSLSVRYLQDRFLPDKALDIIDETASRLRSENKISDHLKEIRKLEAELKNLLSVKDNFIGNEEYEEAIQLQEEEAELIEKIDSLAKKQREIERKNKIEISSEDVAKTISQITNIPLEKLISQKLGRLKNLEKNLNSKIVGQKEAVSKLTGAIFRSQTGVSDPERPLGSFLFLGPTGVGKTLTAKILAEDFFQDKNSLIRIDMSEFSERHSIAQLIGAPAGYVGYGEGGKLTEKVRRHPYSLILFDEIEKSHPDVWNILLQILEEGFLTDAEGRKVSFRNTIVILTSNLGTSEFTNLAKIGFGSGSGKQKIHSKFNSVKENVLKELSAQMKPELINRLDNLIVFNALDSKEIKKISRLEINKLKKRLKKKSIDIVVSPEAISLIAEKSLSFEQGARHIRKNVQEMIENEVAQMIIEERVKKNKIEIDAKKEKIVLK